MAEIKSKEQIIAELEDRLQGALLADDLPQGFDLRPWIECVAHIVVARLAALADFDVDQFTEMVNAFQMVMVVDVPFVMDKMQGGRKAFDEAVKAARAAGH